MNLLKETIETIEKNGKKTTEILWVGNETHRTDWDNYFKIADTEYDSGFGSPEVAQDLLIVGKDWWLERREYDGSEWWEYKEIPKEPERIISLNALTVNQAKNNGLDVSCGWESLLSLNGL